MKKAELITGVVSGIAVGIILSPKKIYELKNKTKENYYNFLLDNGPISKEMVLNYLKGKRVAYKNRENDEILDEREQEIEEVKNCNEEYNSSVSTSKEEHN